MIINKGLDKKYKDNIADIILIIMILFLFIIEAFYL